MAAAASETSHGGYFEGDVVLGKYVLLAPLAKGGMGAVWRGRNELLGTDVAIKLITNGGNKIAGAPPSDTTSMLRRAHAEARVAAQLRHPAVCQALDFGVTDLGDPVIVSELLQGEPLDEVLLAEGKLDTARAVELLLPIVDALGAAHARGIVHRDVKPSNIFLARDLNGGLQPKLLDFGIARAVCDSTRITAAGMVCGTPDYMSPEQARGKSDVDGRSDLWSICATLFELVSGKVPFPGENYNAVMFSVINEPLVPLSGFNPEDAGLVQVLERGLSKRREARFQTAAELAAALSGLLSDPKTARPIARITPTLESARLPTGTSASRASSAQKRLLPLGALLAVLLMALSGFSAGLLYRSSARASTPTVSAETESPATQRLAPRPVAMAMPVVAERTPVSAATLSSTAPSQPRPKARATVVGRQSLERAVSPSALPVDRGASATALDAATQPPGRINEAPSSRPPPPNALGYDFGL